MNQYQNPKWWSPDNDFAWDHVKLAMKRDWQNMKNGNQPDSSRIADHTARQANGMEPILPLGKASFEEFEPACRFGFGARLKYDDEYPEWDSNLEIQLAKDWRTLNPTRKQTWEQDRSAIRYGWNFVFDEEQIIAYGHTTTSR
jgi:hypothetical protein